MTEPLPVLSVRDWDKLYECNRTRTLKKMDWFPLKNDQASDGYTELLAHDRGLSHFGAFVAILQVASKCQQRGVLIRTNGQPHTAGSIARIVRADEATVAEAITRLLSIGWLVSEIRQDDAGIRHPDAGIRQDDAVFRQDDAGDRPYSTVQDKTGQDTVSGGAAREFIDQYPRKTGLQIGLQTYLSMIEAGEESAVFAGLDRWKKSEAWAKDSGKWIPEPGRWLTDRRWQEYPAPAAPTGGYVTPPFKESF